MTTRHFDLWKLWPFWREIALFGLGACTSIWTWLRVRRAQSWPSAQGTIGQTQVRANRSGYTKPWAAEFTYTYVVNGEYYSGRHHIKARSERRAEKLSLGWKGRMVVVRYSPDKHDVSLLLKTDQPGGQLGG